MRRARPPQASRDPRAARASHSHRRGHRLRRRDRGHRQPGDPRPVPRCASAAAYVEADVFPLNHPERADLIDGTIGELSPFHATYGYYAQGVAETTATLPAGWKQRLVAIENTNTRGAKGLCLEIHDLLVSKAIAGRDKDLAFLREAAQRRLAAKEILLERLGTVRADEALKRAASIVIEQAF